MRRVVRGNILKFIGLTYVMGIVSGGSGYGGKQRGGGRQNQRHQPY